MIQHIIAGDPFTLTAIVIMVVTCLVALCTVSWLWLLTFVIWPVMDLLNYWRHKGSKL